MEKEDLSKYKGSLSHLAFDSSNCLGRRFKNDTDTMYYFLDPFLIDREKIRLSKSYRRLADKTQVFPPSLNANARNRLIHTDEVVNISSLLAVILGLNVYLAEAIAYGHDIGHTPFGHLGERLIQNQSTKNFRHNIMSVVVAQKIERKGLGLNLCYETLEGILNHSRGAGEMKTSSDTTEESTLVMFADKIAYTFSDLNDTVRVGYMKESNLPKIVKFFGKNQRERVARTLLGIAKECATENRVSFSKSETARNFAALRSWMYDNIYHTLDIESRRVKTYNELKAVASFIEDHYQGEIDPYLAVSLMTDSEALEFSACLNNGGIKNMNYGFIEIIENLQGKKINIFDPDLEKEKFSFK